MIQNHKKRDGQFADKHTQTDGSISRCTGAVFDAELHHKVEPRSTLTQLIVGAITLPFHQLSLLANRRAALTRLAPVPVV